MGGGGYGPRNAGPKNALADARDDLIRQAAAGGAGDVADLLADVVRNSCDVVTVARLLTLRLERIVATQLVRTLTAL